MSFVLPPKVCLYDFHFMMTNGPVFHRGEGKHDHFENTALKIVLRQPFGAGSMFTVPVIKTVGQLILQTEIKPRFPNGP